VPPSRRRARHHSNRQQTHRHHLQSSPQLIHKKAGALPTTHGRLAGDHVQSKDKQKILGPWPTSHHASSSRHYRSTTRRQPRIGYEEAPREAVQEGHHWRGFQCGPTSRHSLWKTLIPKPGTLIVFRGHQRMVIPHTEIGANKGWWILALPWRRRSHTTGIAKLVIYPSLLLLVLLLFWYFPCDLTLSASNYYVHCD